MSDYISHDHERDGIDRRGFLQCMAWAGTGLLWPISGGVLVSKTLAQVAKAGEPLPATDLSFLQISDSHIGFSKEANKDVTETFKIALDRINAMPTPPSFGSVVSSALSQLDFWIDDCRLSLLQQSECSHSRSAR